MRIRQYDPSDIQSIREIYKHYVENTAVTFDMEVPSEKELLSKWDSHTLDLVVEQEGQVLGYAYAAPFRIKKAYQWISETTIYLSSEHTGFGVGRPLYGAMIHLLEQMGYLGLVAGITVPNEASDRFHRSFGFEKMYTLERIGYKQGSWHNVDWFRKELSTYPEDPKPPRTLCEFSEQELHRILERFSVGK